jgi:hypothetical protein
VFLACRTHKGGPGVQISPDLSPRLGADAKRAARQTVDIIYQIDGVTVACYHVSQSFAEEHGLKAGVFAYPGIRDRDHALDLVLDKTEVADPEPVWVKKLIVCCLYCYTEFHQGKFDKNFVWCPDSGQTGID